MNLRNEDADGEKAGDGIQEVGFLVRGKCLLFGTDPVADPVAPRRRDPVADPVALLSNGLLLIIAGGFAGWTWIRNPWFRAAHLTTIGVVVFQAWLGVTCPLTILEMHFRKMAGDITYEGTFVSHWLRKLLYYNAPLWVFVLCYTLFALALIGGWVKLPPLPFRNFSNQME